jgi:hypothetical protein
MAFAEPPTGTRCTVMPQRPVGRNTTGTSPRLAVPTTTAVLDVGSCPRTVRVNVCVVCVRPFDALRVMAYVPWLPAAGVPASLAVPSPFEVKVTQLGSASDWVIVAVVWVAVLIAVNAPRVPAAAWSSLPM